MFDILSEFLLAAIVWILVEAIFYGFCYFTGMLLTPLVTFGKYYPGNVIKNKELRKVHRSEGNKLTYVKANKRYLNSETVSLIGMAFWLTFAVVAMIVFILSAS